MTASTIQPVQAMPLAQPGDYSREQLDLIKNTLAPETNDLEFKFFMEVARLQGLNPLMRQIHAVMRWDNAAKRKKMVIQTGIDGYRLIAARTGQHVGTTDATFGPATKDGFPSWAQVTVKKLVHGHIAEYPATAHWDEYVQTTKEGKPNSMWAGRPKGQLSKCAEALALRKAFPAELSGVYTDTEMEQADSGSQQPQEGPSEVRQESKPTEDPESARRRVYGPKLGNRRNALKTYGVTEEQVNEELAKLAPWYASDENAENAVAALTAWGMRLKAEHEAQVSQSDNPDTVDAEFTPAEPTPDGAMSEGQRKALCAHANRAGAKTSEDRAALWGWALSADGPVGTKTLTGTQAGTLLDWAGGLADGQMVAALGVARKASPAPTDRLLDPAPVPFHPDADRRGA